MAAGSGDVAYTGVGFTPTSIDAFGGIDATAQVFHGKSDSAKGVMVTHLNSSSAWKYNATYLVIISIAAGEQLAVLKSYDADGFTLTWTKTGTPTGTATLYFKCCK